MTKKKSIEIILKYFPDISIKQQEQFAALEDLYTYWNDQINVVSRKDIDQLYIRHILHSLAIAKVASFKPGTKLLDVGTGGGFPGIPLAILFPESDFMLVDSIGKKIKVVNEVKNALGLKNVTAEQSRAEKVKDQFDFVISRAVTYFPRFYAWIRNKVSKKNFNGLKNGVLYLKGGDLDEEFKDFEDRVKMFEISDFYEEDFFDTKKVVYLPF